MHASLRPLLTVAALTLAATGCTKGTGAGSGVTATTSAAAAPSLPAGVRVVTGVTYAPGLLADLYLPSEPAQGPTVVWVHGGGFTAGDRSQLGHLAAALAERRYPGMAIQYRLAEGGPWFPTDSLADPALQAAALAAVEDAGRAVAWLGTDAARAAGIAGGRVVVAGYSAGGITAATLAAEAPGPTLAGAVSIAGAALRPERITAAAPPLLLLHGTADDVVPIHLARATCDAATASGARCQLEEVAGGGHSLIAAQPELVVASVASFLHDLA